MTIWPSLFNNVHINFAYKTFKWGNEAKGKKAAVHCVIIGFSDYKNNKEKKIFDSNTQLKIVSNINPYLVDAPNTLIERRNNPISDSPKMLAGNKPVDYNALKIEPSEYKIFVDKEPQSLTYIRKMVGAEELINKKERYCLWLINCPPNDLRKMPMALEKVQMCRDKRLKSKKAITRKLAAVPTLFAEIRQPNSRYLLIPAVSSERRTYIPMDFMDENYIPVGTLFIENATLYHFGVLTSSVHMAWMRAVAGRRGMSYSYSNQIVYNNFPWPNPTEEQKKKIEKTAQMILDARAKYPNSSLADLYNELTMPPELRKAHQMNDVAVMEAYGFDWRHMTESDCVAKLMEMYQKLVKEKD